VDFGYVTFTVDMHALGNVLGVPSTTIGGITQDFIIRCEHLLGDGIGQQV